MNSRERLRREGDRMFIPINVDGGFNDNFNIFSGGRLYSLVGVVVGYLVVMFLLAYSYIGAMGLLIGSLVYWVFGLFIIRKFVIREKYYYNVISKMREYERTTPSIFWGISDIIVDTDGAILHYTDGKIGAIVRLNKNIITGKNASAMDVHYDSVSDFYNNIILKGYKFILFNKMETLGKDMRLHELDKLVYKVDNANLKKLMELQVKYLKVNARETLYETDYVLIYTDKVLKRDTILDDVRDSLEILTIGSNFSTYDILDKMGVVDLVNMEYGTKRFDYIEATMSVFKNGSYRGLNGEPIIITDIELNNGTMISLSDIELKRLKKAVQEYKISEKKEYVDVLDIIKRDTVVESVEYADVGIEIGVDILGLASIDIEDIESMEDSHVKEHNVKVEPKDKVIQKDVESNIKETVEDCKLQESTEIKDDMLGDDFEFEFEDDEVIELD